jgi:hypothetical protein
MTKEKQFNLYGCASQILIYLAGLERKPVTIQDFCNRFEKYFPEGQYGGLSEASIREIAKKMNLCSESEIVYDKQVVKALISNGKLRGALAITRLPTNHCMLLVPPEKGEEWNILHFDQHGMCCKIPHSDLEMDERKPYFVLLR